MPGHSTHDKPMNRKAALGTSKRRKSVLSFLVLVAGSVILLSLLRGQDLPPATVSVEVDVQSTHPPLRPADAASPQATTPTDLPASAAHREFTSVAEYESVSTFGPLPASLQGTAPIPVFADGNGHLVISQNVPELFEYFLSAVQEEGVETVLGRIKEYLQLTLPSPASEQAMALLDPYLNYKKQLVDFQPSQSAASHGDSLLAELGAVLEANKRIRREQFSPEVAEAFFGEQERYDQYALQYAQVMGNKELDERQREAHLASLAQLLPEPIRERVEYQRQEAYLKRRIEELHKLGDREQQIHALRKDFYGQAEADRLAFLEDRSTGWLERMDVFSRTQAQIMADDSISEKRRWERVEALRRDSFTNDERLKFALHALSKK